MDLVFHPWRRGRRRGGLRVVLGLLLLAAGVITGGVAAQEVVVVAFSTAAATPLNLGFAGFTTELLGTGVEYADTNLQQFAAQLSPGWLLYPGGTTADAFHWATGLTDTNWVNEIAAAGDATPAALTGGTYNALLGKGGAQFTNFAALAGGVGGARILVCVNGFTDTPESAGAFAAFAAANHIPVAAWELCNEPYLFKGADNFFTGAADYAAKMKPYRDAIKAADPNAVVAVFYSDPALTGGSWDATLANYADKYWDAVAYHHYPRLGTNEAFADLMAIDNGLLLTNTTSFLTNHLMVNNGPGMRYLLTEMNPNLGDGMGDQHAPTSSLYAGIWVSEYVMRLSAAPQFTFAGGYQLVNGSGVDLTNKFWNAVDNAAARGQVTNTVGLPFGYFLSAQGSAEAVAYGAINNATATFATQVGTNGPSAPVGVGGVGAMPALHAQAYRGGDGKYYVLITNKGSNAVPVDLWQDGAPVVARITETFVGGPDPAAVNSNPPSPGDIVIHSQAAPTALTVAPYSVTRFEWQAAAVPAPVLTADFTNGLPELAWTGVTNTIYRVQRATDPGGPWTTLQRATAAAASLTFTDPTPPGPAFYRVQVP